MYDGLWKRRCEKVHDDTDVTSLTVRELDKQIRFYFQNKVKLFDSGDYDRFHMGLHHTSNMPLTQKRDWIQTLSQRQKATDRARRRLVNRIRPITAYFDYVDKESATTGPEE